MTNTTETFEQRIDRERKETQVIISRLAGIMLQVGFTPEIDDEQARSTRAHLRGKDANGAYCAMESDTYGLKGRIQWSCWPPHTVDNAHSLRKTVGQMTVSATKTDAQIVQDIKKRGLAGLAEAVQKVKEHNEKTSAAAEARETFVSDCAAILGCTYQPGSYDRKPRIYEYLSYKSVERVTVEIDHNTTRAELQLSVSPDMAKDLLAFIADRLKTDTKTE